MEKFFVTVAVLAGILIVLIVAWTIYRYIKNQKLAEEMLSSNKRGANFACNLLKTAYPANHIFNKVTLIHKSKNGTATEIPTDLILVDRGGVFVIKVQNMGGTVNNHGENWTISNSKGVWEFSNPFAANRPAVKYLENTLNREGIDNVPVHSLVVFTGKKTGFMSRMQFLLTAERFIDTVKDINRNKFLSSAEVSAAIASIKRHCVVRTQKQQR